MLEPEESPQRGSTPFAPELRKSQLHRPPHMLSIPTLKGVCIFCGQEYSPFTPSNDRHCCTEGLDVSVTARFGADIALYATVFPKPLDDAWYVPPHPAYRPQRDGFVVSADDRHGSTTLLADENALASLPYPAEHPRIQHLKCGYATLTNMGHLATQFGFESNCVDICDMSTYYYSHTLKAPRSWAVVNNALHHGIRHLGVWTAGNAGFSLAKTASAVNLLLPPEERLKVYCYAEQGKLSTRMQQSLRSVGAEVHEFSNPSRVQKVLSPKAALDRLRGLGVELRPEEYWDVSDGWDGVGLYMYRLLGRQLCSHLRPNVIVAPVGTGNLFFGLYQGIMDCVEHGIINRGECRLVGAVPTGDSIVTNLRKYAIELPLDETPMRSSGTDPVCPKLDTIYTPLLLALYNALTRDRDWCHLMFVNRESQKEVVRRFHRRGSQIAPITAEPSALVCFGVLESLAAMLLRKESSHGARLEASGASDRVIVISTGCGLMDDEELSFLDDIT